MNQPDDLRFWSEQLRLLQTVDEVAPWKNPSLVLPFPIGPR